MPRKKKILQEEKEEEKISDLIENTKIKEKLENEELNKISEEDKEEITETKKKLLERAAELQKTIEEKKIKEELQEELKKSKTFVPIEDYLKYSVYLGTKVITPHMRKFVYKRRADGIAVIDVNQIDKALKNFIKELVKYDPEDFIIVCKREAGWKAVNLFSQLTGVKVFTKKYPAGIITNTNLVDFFDPKMVFICDPWVDKNALNDAKKTKKKIFALCDTNNYTFDIDLFIPCNNKSNKSIGLIFYIIAKEYLKEKKINKNLPSIEDFVGEKI
ncbi:MAG: 30S ribosomal protein S2 [Candidatus Pacearchaeota archaeon]